MTLPQSYFVVALADGSRHVDHDGIHGLHWKSGTDVRLCSDLPEIRREGDDRIGWFAPRRTQWKGIWKVFQGCVAGRLRRFGEAFPTSTAPPQSRACYNSRQRRSEPLYNSAPPRSPPRYNTPPPRPPPRYNSPQSTSRPRLNFSPPCFNDSQPSLSSPTTADRLLPELPEPDDNSHMARSAAAAHCMKQMNSAYHVHAERNRPSPFQPNANRRTPRVT